jgi:hypothetical protein
MANAVSGASGVQHVAKVQQVENSSAKASKSANKAKSGPEDTVSISPAGRAGQKASQAGPKK